MLSGGCLCGAIRYQTDGAPFHESICHCSLCRRASGAPFVAWFSVPRESLALISGSPSWFRSSPSAERGFCSRCGTALFFRSRELTDEIDITIASLEEPGSIQPCQQLYAADRIRWVGDVSTLPAFPAARRQCA
ncbi:MAG: GFA family protein [Acetobacteraceae bacterium]